MAEAAKGRRGSASRVGAGAPTVRTDTTRPADHDAIGRLTDELLPSLIAKLGASGLGEIEVREGEWHVRVRGLGDGATVVRGRASDRSDRAARAHVGHDRSAEAYRSAEVPQDVARDVHHELHHDAQRDPDSHRAVATSPAVGVFQPRPGMTAGTRVRAGDRLGHVDMLGVPQDVVAPVDGLVGASLVEPGEAVEYGQELIRIELTGTPSAASAAGAHS